MWPPAANDVLVRCVHIYLTPGTLKKHLSLPYVIPLEASWSGSRAGGLVGGVGFMGVVWFVGGVGFMGVVWFVGGVGFMGVVWPACGVWSPSGVVLPSLPPSPAPERVPHVLSGAAVIIIM